MTLPLLLIYSGLPGQCSLSYSGQKQKKGGQMEVYSVENCGMMNEKVTREIGQLDDTSGYLTIVIVKEH